MSGTAGGSQLKGDKFKTRATPYIPEMLQVGPSFLPLFSTIVSDFFPFFLDFWPCSLDSWRPDAENGRKMGENG